MQWVDAKEQGDPKAAPGSASHAPKHQKQQHAVGGMEQEVAQVVAGRLHAKELAIEHDGEPNEGIPRAADRVGEGPAHASPSESMGHIAVLGNEGGVIDVNEAVADGGQEYPGD